MNIKRGLILVVALVLLSSPVLATYSINTSIERYALFYGEINGTIVDEPPVEYINSRPVYMRGEDGSYGLWAGDSIEGVPYISKRYKSGTYIGGGWRVK